MFFPIPRYLDLPLFPLPGVVLLPSVMMPLRIFEPRYVKMLSDVMAGDKQCIAMAQLKEKSFDSTQERPEVHTVVGLGEIWSTRELGDGSSQILLLGRARCLIQAERP